MRRAKRARPVQRAIARQLPEQASHLGDLDRFREFERRQDSRQAAGQHRLARARWPAQQQVVSSGGGHLQRTLGLFLSVHLAQVVLKSAFGRRGGEAGRRGGDWLGAKQVVHDRDE